MFNFQVKYNAESDQALIEFAHHNSARAAITDKDAVLGNRFIRILWYYEGNTYTSSRKNDVSILCFIGNKWILF